MFSKSAHFLSDFPRGKKCWFTVAATSARIRAVQQRFGDPFTLRRAVRPRNQCFWVRFLYTTRPSQENNNNKVITVDADIGSSIERAHYALIPAHDFLFTPAMQESIEAFRLDWEHLEADPYMADGGNYRFRRYGLFRLSATTGELSAIAGASFYQSAKINPLNGGQPRHFAPLTADIASNAFLREVILFDFAQLTANKHIDDDWLIGVHQIRILAADGIPGNPTPEGTHRDDENFTAQHLIGRHNISGGINYFYGNGPAPTECPQVVWEQQVYFDSYYFDRSLWHSVSRIVLGDGDGDGYRDVLLIDFVESSKLN